MANPKAFKYNERATRKAVAIALSNGTCSITYYGLDGEVVAQQMDKVIDLKYPPMDLMYHRVPYRLTIKRAVTA